MWSIGIYTGDSPCRLGPTPAVRNPVLSAADVTGIPAAFVADPFMARRQDKLFMFFEVMNSETERGEIGLATSNDGLQWSYQQTVLTEPFHLSYPYVFEWRNEYYMTPETLGANAVCLYKAGDFPLRWSLVEKLIDGPCADPSILYFGDLWWLFVCSTPYQHDTLRLYFASRPAGPWREHPRSPIVKNDQRCARPAGRILTVANRPIRFAQDCVPEYGTRVRAFEILELSTTRYVERELRESPVLQASGSDWNALGMHHVDACQRNGQWIACVDGRGTLPIGDCRLPIGAF